MAVSSKAGLCILLSYSTLNNSLYLVVQHISESKLIILKNLDRD